MAWRGAVGDFSLSSNYDGGREQSQHDRDTWRDGSWRPRRYVLVARSRAGKGEKVCAYHWSERAGRVHGMDLGTGGFGGGRSGQGVERSSAEHRLVIVNKLEFLKPL
ncbi:hypothetical protein BaRGS_00010251 [Batillaria attramentaria]|uniref:Uncharacterized protein n=1 Tax=Batillaria attramentaria TaxID=370345 RepID=A0ABD0LH69_9CAEN